MRPPNYEEAPRHEIHRAKDRPITANRWFKLVWIIPLALILLLAIVLTAQWMRQLAGVQSFIAQYPGESHLPAGGAPVGFPAWLSWQHFLNTLIIVLLIRSGWNVRTNQRPDAYWTRNNTGAIRTENPPPKSASTCDSTSRLAPCGL